MKNHIKNYIKIMGLAAVPFGTAQVHGITEYKIEVKKKETDTDFCFSIGATCIFETELNQDCARVEIVLNKDANNVPCILYVSDGSCEFRFFEDQVVSYGGVTVHRINARMRGKKSKLLDEAVAFGLYYCLSGGKSMDVGEAMVSFSFHPIRLSAVVSISVDSNVPVLFNGRFCSATTNNPADKGEFFDYGELMFPRCYLEDRESLKVIDMRIESRENRIEQMGKDLIERKFESKEERRGHTVKRLLEKLQQLRFKAKKDEEPAKPMKARDRIKALFEADKARREKDPELEKERMRREKAVINARNRIREFIRIDLESRELIKEDNKIGKNEIIVEDPKVDKKEEKLFERNSKEDYFKGFDAFKEKLNAEFKARLKKGKVEKNEIIIEDEKKEEDKKEDEKIDQSGITFGKKPCRKYLQ